MGNSLPPSGLAEDRSNARAALLAISQQARALPDGIEAARPADEKQSQGSFLCGDVEDEIRRNHASLYTWLASAKGMLFQLALLTVFVVTEVVQAMMTARVLKNDSSVKVQPLASSIPAVIAGHSVLIGIVLTVFRTMTAPGRSSSIEMLSKAFSWVFNWQDITRMAPVAVLLSLSAVFSMLVYTRLDAGTSRTLDQLKLPATAALSYSIVGRKYSLQEWCALIIVLFGVVSFYCGKIEQDNIRELHYKCNYPEYCFPGKPQYDLCALRVDGRTIYGEAISNSTHHEILTFPIKASSNDNTGLLFFMMSMICSCIGNLLAEKILKDNASTPFPTQMAHMNITAFPVAFAMSFIVPLYFDNKEGRAIWWRDTGVEGSGAGFFQGFSFVTCVMIAIHLLTHWLGGIIVKQFSTVVKIVAKSGAMILTIVFDGTLIRPCHADPLPLAMYAIAFIIAFDTVMLSLLPKPKQAEPLLPAEACDVEVAPGQGQDVRVELQTLQPVSSGRA
eukprot:TRINITY_DN24094_c0_g1_i1.p1 TRINITY_DN24094_c0_g1~~TRINITY_DN24094_c0_g1_i1.p1  ORF type:complete len:504 (+),score=67.39 TRINITY_DN24094_c0_g1_i1:77-1588(+)